MGGVAAGAADIFGGAAAVDAGVAAASDVAATAAVDAGVAAASDVATGALSVGDAVAAGATTANLVSAGVPVADLISAGVPVSDLTAAGVTAEQIAAVTPTLETAAAGAESIPFQLADGTMGSIQGGNILDSAGNVVAQGGMGGTLGQLAGYAKTGAQLIGGIGQLGKAGALLGGGGQTKPGVADPYAQYRPQNAAQLQNLLSDPSTITSTPGYQFNLQQGLNAQTAKQAAQGRLVSGGALLEANQFGQQYATSSLQQQQALLAQLSGATQSPAGAAQAQQGINFGQVGAGALGLQQLASGAGNVLNPLATLYAQYNNPSPSVS
jgi:hypothetical protein